MQDPHLINIKKLDSDSGPYVEKLGENPLMTQFNINAKHAEKDLSLHWPILDDVEWEEKAREFVLGPIKNEIKNFANQNDYQDVLVTIIAAKNTEIIALPEFEEASFIRFETEKGYTLILICQESPWHAPPSVFGEHGNITKLDGDEDVYRFSERFLDMFFSQNANIMGLGAQDALRRTLIRMYQFSENNTVLTQQLFSMLQTLGLLSGRENLQKLPASLVADIEKNSVFLLEPVTKSIQAYALTRLMDPRLSAQERLYFRGLAQQIYMAYEPPITQAAHLAAADIDHRHETHPNAQKAHRDMGLRQRDARRQQTLEPGMDGGGSEG